jgi:UDP-GlcNAc:undecaprenyl-phosphate GlcNAc-1-phosphate transferase
MFAALAYLNVTGLGGWWTVLATVIALCVAFVLLGYHRLLRRLPAFSGERPLGWRDRRREVMQVLAMIKHLESEHDDQGPERWQRLAPDVAPIFTRLGVPAFSVHVGEQTVVHEGDPRDAWAWLGLPLGPEGAEIRLALAVRLPDLQQEQLMLLERAVSLVAGRSIGARQISGVHPKPATVPEIG